MCDVRILILNGLGYDHEAGIKATVLEDLDFADDINCATCHPGIAICMKRLGDWQGKQPE